MKLYIYKVQGFEFVDFEAWGTAWEQAKEKATELHTPIFRTVLKSNKLRQEVFYKGGIFNSIEFMRGDNVKVF